MNQVTRQSTPFEHAAAPSVPAFRWRHGHHVGITAARAWERFVAANAAFLADPTPVTAIVAIHAADAFNCAYAPEAAERLTALYRGRVEDFLERRCVACPS